MLIEYHYIQKISEHMTLIEDAAIGEEPVFILRRDYISCIIFVRWGVIKLYYGGSTKQNTPTSGAQELISTIAIERQYQIYFLLCCFLISLSRKKWTICAIISFSAH